MKNQAIAFVAISSFTLVVHAQSTITIYGNIDASIMSQSKTGPTGQAGRVVGFVDGSLFPSIYGFKGTEDIGGGLIAGFNLQGGFNSGTGYHNSPGVYQTQIFGREAQITIGGDWGTIGAGMQIDPAALAAIPTEPRGATYSFSNLGYLILTTLGNNTAGGGALQGGIFDDNSLTYIYKKNGLYVGLEYGFGSVAGNTSANSTQSIGLSYTNQGFVASASYAQDKNINATIGGNSSQISVFGIGYEFKQFVIRSQYGIFRSATGEQFINGTLSASDVHSAGVGLDWNSSATNKVNFAYYDAKDTSPQFGGKTKEISLLDIYSLSKNSKIYAQLVDVKADANAGLSAAIGGASYVPSGLSASAGTSTFYFGVGMNHTF